MNVLQKVLGRWTAGWVLCLLVAACGGGGGGGSSGGGSSAVAITVSGAGSVSASVLPACRTSCSVSVDAGAQVSLTATPDAGYKLAGWLGACQGAGACVLTSASATTLSAVFTPVSTAPPTPKVLYTDVVSGPTTGGENGLGGYLSIFGMNFGGTAGLGSTTRVFIGGVEVANYRYLGNAVVGAKLGVQQITVQLGALGNPVQGQPLPVKVVVNGLESNTDRTFTPNPGRVLFVALSGNDGTAAAGDINRPWRSLQNGGEFSGVMATAQAGDQIVIRGGNWNDATGVDKTWVRFQTRKGSPPNGSAGSGWIHLTAYPGPVKGNAIEDVHYTAPAATGGGIQGPSSANTGLGGEYVSVSNLRMDVNAAANSDAAPVNLQYTVGHWRVVNNQLGPWPSSLTLAANGVNARAAGVSGHGNDIVVMGNRIHDIHCDPAALENHGIYADTTARNWEVAYNWIHDITGGSSVQFFDNEGGMGTRVLPTGEVWQGFTGIRVHHNWLENSAKYGLNIGDPGANAGAIEMRAWNNVIIGTGQAPVRTSTSAPAVDITYAHNTIYDASTAGDRGMFYNDYKGDAPRVIRVYDNIMAFGPRTKAGNVWFVDLSASSSGWSFRNNLYWDRGLGRPALALDTARVVGDPGFAGAAGGDLSLILGSPAVDRAAQAVPFAITDDLTSLVARPQGAANDIGALERVP
jgi:hypothetical protein